MTRLEIVLDTVMCFGWIITYILVLIGSLKFKFPLIPLSTQLAIASLEIAVFLGFVEDGEFLNYPFLGYTCWSITEIAIIVLAFRQRGVSKKQKNIYCAALIFLIVLMYLILKLENGMMYFTYINTITGIIFWLYYIFEKKYPIKPFTLCLFIVKFLSDILAGVVYYDKLNITVFCLCLLLPCIDFIFIVVWLYRYFNKEKYDAFCDKYEKYLPKIKLYIPEKEKSACGKMNKKRRKK